MDLAKMNTRLTQAQIDTLCAKRPVRMSEGGKVMTGPVRLSFPSLHKKTKLATAPAGSEKYQAALLFPHSNISILMQALVAAVRLNYPNVSDPMVMLDRYNKNHPVRDQGLKVSTAEGGRDPVGKSTGGYIPGLPFMNPKSGNGVPCYKAVNGEWKPFLHEEIEAALYAGCWVEAQISIFKSTTQANPGVAVGLQGIWKLADDNSFSGGGGAAASDGGSAGDALTVEDPNAIVQPGGVASNNWDEQPAAAPAEIAW